MNSNKKAKRSVLIEENSSEDSLEKAINEFENSKKMLMDEQFDRIMKIADISSHSSQSDEDH